MYSDITTPEFQTSTDLSLGSLQFENLSLESLSFDALETQLFPTFSMHNIFAYNFNDDGNAIVSNKVHNKR
jgi:hypothetical protein